LEASETFAQESTELDSGEQPVAEETALVNEPAAAPAPDLAEQISALTAEVQGLRGSVGQPQQDESPYDGAIDLYEQLAGVPGEEGYDPLESIISERVAEALNPVLGAIEQDRRRGQLDKLASDHPELLDRDYQEAITDRLAPLADRYGNEMILTDPDLVEAVLVAEKAARASAAEVPAEQAANQGARLESAVVASSPEAQMTPEQEIEKSILAARGGGDAFTP
jgi:hypothetical protein